MFELFLFIITEAWLDDNQDFTFDYFVRKATQGMINTWLADRVIKIAANDRKTSVFERSSNIKNSLKSGA